MNLQPIGYVRSSRIRPEDDHWDSVPSRIELDQEHFDPSALQGLEAFSHVEIVFHMHQVAPEGVSWGARHPRGNTQWPRVGIFSQRAKNRPNPIGVTVCRIREIEGTTLHLTGLDAIDGTPVLDIKPWVREFGPRGELKQPDWMTELMASYWK